VIVNNPQAVIVRMLVDAGATLVVLDTPEAVCQERLKQRFNEMNSPTRVGAVVVPVD
jgi:hypothetical protein